MSAHRWHSKARASACLQTAQDCSAKTMTLNPRRARWGTRTATPVDSIVAGKAIVVVVVIVVIVVIAVVAVVASRDVAAEDGVSGAVPPLSSLLSSAAAEAALYLIPRLLNVRHLIITLSHPDRFVRPFPHHHHRPPVRAPPTTFLCRLPPLLIVKCLHLMLPMIVVP